MPDPILSVQNLSKSYATGAGQQLLVLDDVSLEISGGQLVVIVGESGSGKSTLLHLMGALDRPDKGRVVFNGENIFEKDDHQLATFRNSHVGFVFQFHHLLPEFTAVENVMMPALISGSSQAEARSRAMQLLESLGLRERSSHKPATMSGGEQQRVAVARALMNKPSIILGDEPTGNLDAPNARSLHEELLSLARNTGQTFVLATHNPGLADLADRVFVLENKHLTERVPT